MRGFRALTAAQFFGVLNDNTFKLLVIFLVLDRAQGGSVELVGALFILPFILFSPFAGYLADRFPKSLLLQATKVAELLILAAGSYFLVHEQQLGLLLCLFLLGCHSALFSPAKYGLLPELLPEEELSRANGLLELWTFLPIILGTILGGLLVTLGEDRSLISAALLLSCSALGTAASFFIPRSQSLNPQAKLVLNPLRSLRDSLAEIGTQRELFSVILATCFFWFVGQVFQLNVPLFSKQVLLLESFETSLLLATLAIGIGLGSFFAGRVSAGKVELGLVPLGAVGLGIGALALGIEPTSAWVAALLLFIAGISGGLFIIPLNSYVQAKSPASKRGQYIATSNVLQYSAMLLATGGMWFVLKVLALSPKTLFLGVGVMSVTLAVLISVYMPRMFIRCLNWLITHLVYRVRSAGLERIPKEGGALLVCNHVSYVDPSILMASCERPIRFLMYRPIYEAMLVNPIARILGVIPIAPEGGPKEILRSLQEANQALKNGELVCIFAEGQLTRIGQLLPFSRGLERIVKGSNCPIIPLYLDQIWGSIFSFAGGRFFFKLPKEIPYPVTLSVGQPLPADAQPYFVRQAVQELGAEAFALRQRETQLLHLGFIRRAKRRLFARCMSDANQSISYVDALARCLIITKRLRQQQLGDKIGIALPPSVGGALTNLAVLCAGSVPVNLNYTASAASLKSAAEQCEMKAVISSQAFIDKVGLELPAQTILLENLVKDLSPAEKFRAWMIALCLPAWCIERFVLRLRTKSSALATIIFSSGSTGEPKGVMLSHANITSNLESLFTLFQLNRKDCVLGVLPFFHSFGFTGTLWLPLLAGIRAVYHPNPMDGSKIGELAGRERATVLMATPTFLLTYIRKCEPAQFAGLRYVIVGAEKLKEKLAQSFFDRFGVRPLEGYGCTELSPVALLNVPDFADGAVKQRGNKTGSAGHPIPGVAVRVVDPDSLALLPPNQAGLLLVKGPNVMLGYLGSPLKTAEVISDGWYQTGDIAQLDEEGFVTIVDRLSRFSKIGGEMVPHLKIEAELHAVLESVEQCCVVVAVPDEKKGEKLVVLTTRQLDAGEMTKKLSERGLPNLWIPKPENFFWIESIPLLGSGKIDLKGIKARALELARE